MEKEDIQKAISVLEAASRMIIMFAGNYVAIMDYLRIHKLEDVERGIAPLCYYSDSDNTLEILHKIERVKCMLEMSEEWIERCNAVAKA